MSDDAKLRELRKWINGPASFKVGDAHGWTTGPRECLAKIDELLASPTASKQWWCPHVGGLGPPFTTCAICANLAANGKTLQDAPAPTRAAVGPTDGLKEVRKCARCDNPAIGYSWYHGNDYFCSFECYDAPRAFDGNTIKLTRIPLEQQVTQLRFELEEIRRALARSVTP
jgi:hypothetical protein